MDKTSSPASLFFSFSLFCLALAIAYFSYAIIKVVEEAPGILNQVEDTARHIDPVVDEIEKVTILVPSIVDEVAMVREQIPPILTEVEALRTQIPGILDEVEQIRLALPPVLEEIANVRGELPALVAESEGYRALVPDILTEVEATREMIPPTMAKAEVLIAKASVAGKQASEGAVTGFFTGIIKAPFKMVSGASKSVFGSQKGLNSKDIELLQTTALEVLNEGVEGTEKSWTNKKTKAAGTIKLEQSLVEGTRICNRILITSTKDKKPLSKESYNVCLSDEGSWEVVKP